MTALSLRNEISLDFDHIFISNQRSFVSLWKRVRGKMRFWGKTKYGDKKTSREKLICGADSMDGDYGDTGPLLGEGALPKTQNTSISRTFI